MSLVTETQLPNIRAKLWIILVGVNYYQDPHILNLNYCAYDCQGLADALNFANQSSQNTKIFAHYDGASQLPDRSSIITSLQQFRLAQPEDTVLFYFSGHGFLNPNNRPVLCVSDTQLDNLNHTGLPLDTLLDEFKLCPAQRQLVWLDACQEKVNLTKYENPNAQLLTLLEQQAEKSQNFYAMLSCDRHEHSWEIYELQHGLFTYYLIEGLRGKAADDQGNIEVKQLFTYVRNHIRKYIQYWNSPDRSLVRQEGLSKGLVITPSRSQTPQQILRGSDDIVLGTAITSNSNRKALVVKSLAFSETTVNLCQILQAKGGFDLDYSFPEDKNQQELENTISLSLQSSTSKTVLLYLAGKIEEADKSFYKLWLSDETYITFNWLKEQLDKSPIPEKIIIFDCFSTSNLDNCFHLFKPSAELSQAIIAASISEFESQKFLTQLVNILETAAQSQAEFWLAELITQLQKARRLQPEITLNCWLSGTTEVVDILLPATERTAVNFDANYCPYKGLQAFTKQDANFFYGREDLIHDLLSRLKTTSFLAVIGASGSGKSSLVQAGVLPHLETKGLLNESAEQLQICQTWVMRPGHNPLAALVNTLATNNPDFFEGVITSGVDSFVFWLQQQSQPMSVLVIDQFEELFTLAASRELQKFLQLILATCDRAHDCFKVIITLRDDFMKECLNIPELGEIIQESHILVPSYLTEEQYRQIIVQPAHQVGLSVETELVNVLLKEVQSGSLPLLQFALEELWRVRSPGSLTLQDYQAHIGGISQLLEHKADLAYQNLTPEQQECAQWIFLSLVRLGEGKEDTRRRLTRSQLLVSKYDKDLESRELFQSTLQALIYARLIIVSLEDNLISPPTPPLKKINYQVESAFVSEIESSQNSAITVEVIHEILIRNWQTLRWWLDENRDRLRLMREIEQQSNQWLQNQQHTDYLLRGNALARIEDFYVKYADQLSLNSNQFIYECIQERDRQLKLAKRRRRQIIGSLTGGIVAISMVAVAAVWQLHRATTNEINALSNSAEALLALNQELDALVISLKAGKKIKRSLFGADTNIQIKLIGSLQNIFDRVREFNRLENHTDSVNSVAFSPDGQIIASASGDDTIKFWNFQGQLLHTLESHTDDVYSVVFSPDGQIIASASGDGTIKFWNFQGQLLHTLEGHTDDVYSVVFSPDGQIIASASGDGTIKLWNFQGQLLHTLEGHTYGIHSVFFNSVAFSPDGQIIASASDDKTIKLWNLQGQLLHSLQDHIGVINSVRFSPDGQIIASASDDNTIKLWNLQGQLLPSLEGHTNVINSVVFSPDGQIIASASQDGTIKLWNLQGQLLPTLIGHNDYVDSIIFSPDGQIIASASSDKTVKLWNLQGQLLHSLEDHTHVINSVAFSPDSQTIASASSDKTVKLWNLQGQLLHTLEGHTDWVNNLVFSPDGQIIASASHDRTIKLWNLRGQLLSSLKGNSGTENSIVFSPDGQIIASASWDNTVKLWSLNLEDILIQGCEWARDYLTNNPHVSKEDSKLCDS